MNGDLEEIVDSILSKREDLRLDYESYTKALSVIDRREHAMPAKVIIDKIRSKWLRAQREGDNDISVLLQILNNR